MKRKYICNIIMNKGLTGNGPSEKKVNRNIKKILNGEHLEVEINKYGMLAGKYDVLVAYKMLGYKMCPVKVVEQDNMPNSLEIVYKLDKGRCYICGRKCVLGGEITDISASIDHVIPVCKGGDNSLKNKRLACRLCNNLKGKFTYSKELVAVIKRELREQGLL